MEILEIIKVILLGIIQGITEWLPVSSTGHLILFDELLPLKQSEIFVNTFLVVIQFGSILAVIFLFFHKLNPFSPTKTSLEKRQTFSLWFKVFIGILPAGILGIIFDDTIDRLFYNPFVVALMLIIYGVIFIIIEKQNHVPKITTFEQLDYKTILLIGFFQALAMIPGTSRSGATIVGALLLGTSRFIAAEFSFFLAIPTMLGASALKLIKAGFAFSSFEWFLLLLGSLVSFLVSIFAIKFLLDYIKRHNFTVFAYYRIILGIVVLLYFYIF